MPPNSATPNDMQLSVDVFTYPNWEMDKTSVEKILCKSKNSFAGTYARRKLKSMEHKQHMHQGTILHPGILKLQTPGAYTYPENGIDMKMVFKHYLLGDDTGTDRVLSQIVFKQKLFDGDRSDPLLVELDNHTFTYQGWNSDKADIENTLATSTRGCVHFNARRMLKGMENRQKVYEEEGCHPGLNILHSEVFSYSTFRRDKRVALDLYEMGDDTAFEQLLKRMQFKQRLEDGDRSHPLLAIVDNAYDLGFTYPRWNDDIQTVEETLIHSVNSFAEFDARRLYRGMENKQRVYSGLDLHPGVAILNSGVFSYSGFKRDKKDAINEYRAGYDSAFEKRLDRIQEKQMMQDGDRTSPVLKTLDRTAAFSSLKRKEAPRKMLVFSPKNKEVSPPEQETPKMETVTERTIVIEKKVERFVPDDCVICLEAPRTHIFSDCGHLTLCNMCAFKPPYNKKKSRKTKFKCPICRKESKTIQKVYF